MSDIKAVRLLSTWSKEPMRRTVSVTKADYDELLYKVPPLLVGVNQKTQVELVVLNKQAAIDFLKQEYNLHGLRGNPTGE